MRTGWTYWRTLSGGAAAAAVLVVGGMTGHVTLANADSVDCAVVSCVAFTFDDGPSPYTDRLLQVLNDNGAKSTFFLIGSKVAADPAAAKRIADAGMEVASHTWDHPNMTTLPPQEIPGEFSRASDAIAAATGQRPTLVRTAGGLINDEVLAEAGRQGLADINWDVIPFDWINDTNTAATRAVLMSQLKPGSVVLFHDTYSSTVDLVTDFLPVLKANGYHLVTVSHLLGPRQPGTTYGSRENGPPANVLTDIAPAAPAPNPPATAVVGQLPAGA
ncbi:polysaccharide deacetylase family protein [Mycobacterium sp. MYCO198283]|nr:polysaccharide deacetylase family protein [Mycobacterium sp. MYCO198283]MCG5430862.1 polysaccharide deacetylase family protein [Mycobacterium sp. MYCO198283]